MGYELFSNKGARRLTSPAIGITRNGRVNMNKATTAILRNNKAEFILLFWDRDKHRIAIKPSKKDSRAYQVGYNERDNSSGFHGGSFIKHIGFNNSENRLLFAEWNEKEGMLEIDVPEEFLKDAGSDLSSPKKKRGHLSQGKA